MRQALVAVVVLLIAAREARAQRAPDMATLDRGDGISKFGLDLAYSALDTGFYDGALRFELHGQYVARSGFGVYGMLPIAKSFGDAPEPLPQPTTALGNLEVGGLYVITNSPTLSWVFRFGLALPTASDDGDGRATNFFATWPRLTDLALAAANTWYVRLGISPLIHVDKLFFRIDVGFDLGIDDGEEDGVELFRLNAGGGIDLGPAALSLELVNHYTLDDFDDNNEFIHTLAFTVRFMGEQLQPFLSLGAPIDDARDAIQFFLMGGIQFAP